VVRVSVTRKNIHRDGSSRNLPVVQWFVKTLILSDKDALMVGVVQYHANFVNDGVEDGYLHR
jgi:hypothetical protein